MVSMFMFFSLRPNLIVYVLSFVMCFYNEIYDSLGKISIAGVNFYFLDILFVFSFVSLFLKNVKRKNFIILFSDKNLILAFLIFFAYPLVRFFIIKDNTDYLKNVINELRPYIYFACTIVLFNNSLRNLKSYVNFLKYLIFLVLIISFRSIYFFLANVSTQGGGQELAGILVPSQSGTVSLFVVFILLFLFSFYINQKNIPKGLIFELIMIVLLASLFVGFSRATWFGFIIGVLIILKKVEINRTRLNESIKLLIILGIAFVIVLGIVSVWSKGKFSAVKIGQAKISDTFSRKGNFFERIYEYEYILTEIQKKPFLGSGLKAVTTYYAPYRTGGVERHFTHNAYLMVFWQLGIVGLLMFLYILVRLYKVLVKTCESAENSIFKTANLSLISFFIIFLIILNVAPNNYGVNTMILFGTACGLIRG